MLHNCISLLRSSKSSSRSIVHTTARESGRAEKSLVIDRGYRYSAPTPPVSRLL